VSRKQPLHLNKVVRSRPEASQHLRAPGDAVLVERGVLRWLVIACPCGCGTELPINLDARAGKAWRMYRTRSRGVSLFPSVWRDTDCESHFIIWRDSIFLFGRRQDDFGVPGGAEETAALGVRVLAQLPPTGFVSYVDVADALGEIPWDVLHALRNLARKGLALEGLGEQQQSTFCRTGD
jgi:Family of unknown function (DUF6527)